MATILFFVVAIGAIWFMQRAQKKQAQARQEQLNAAQKGDQIVTIGGLYGVIDEVDTDAKTVVIDVDGVYLTFELSAIKRVLPKVELPVETVAVEDAVVEEVIETPEDDEVIESAIDSKD